MPRSYVIEPAGVSRNSTTDVVSHCAPSVATFPSVTRRTSPCVSCCALGTRPAIRFSVPHSAEDIWAVAGRTSSNGKRRVTTPANSDRVKSEGGLEPRMISGHYCNPGPLGEDRVGRSRLYRPPPVGGPGPFEGPALYAILPAHASVHRPAAHRCDGPGERVLRRPRVRLRQDPPHPAAAARPRRPRPGAPAARDHGPAPRVPFGEPARHHAGVADARLAGRAGVRVGDPPLAGR